MYRPIFQHLNRIRSRATIIDVVMIVMVVVFVIVIVIVRLIMVISIFVIISVVIVVLVLVYLRQHRLEIISFLPTTFDRILRN